MMKLEGKLAGSIFGINVFSDPNIQQVLKYPSGRKDGNKLGASKRKLKVWPIYYTNKANILVHPDCINSKKFLDSFGRVDKK